MPTVKDARRRPPPPWPVHLFASELQDRDRHIAEVVLPYDDQVAAGQVVAVAEEVRGPELRFREDPAPSLLQDVIRKRHAALDDAIAEPGRALGEDLPHVQLVLRQGGGGGGAAALFRI